MHSHTESQSFRLNLTGTPFGILTIYLISECPLLFTLQLQNQLGWKRLAVIESNHKPNAATATMEPCPQVPHTFLFPSYLQQQGNPWNLLLIWLMTQLCPQWIKWFFSLDRRTIPFFGSPPPWTEPELALHECWCPADLKISLKQTNFMQTAKQKPVSPTFTFCYQLPVTTRKAFWSHQSLRRCGNIHPLTSSLLHPFQGKSSAQQKRK